MSTLKNISKEFTLQTLFLDDRDDLCPLGPSLTPPDGYPLPPAGSNADYVWVRFGLVNQTVPSGVVNPIVVSAGNYIYVKVNTNSSSAPTDENGEGGNEVVQEDNDVAIDDAPNVWRPPLIVRSAEIVVTSSEKEDLGESETEPPYELYYLLGKVESVDGNLSLFSTGCGDLRLVLATSSDRCFLADAGDPNATPPRPSSSGGVSTSYSLSWRRIR